MYIYNTKGENHMDLITTAIKTIASPFEPIFKMIAQPTYKPQNYSTQPRPQNVNYVPAQPQLTPKERLILMNPVYRDIVGNMSDTDVQIKLQFELENQKREQEKIQGKQFVENMQNAKKQRLQMMANQMEMEFSQKQAREMQYQTALASLENKYQMHQQPVRFA
jgi:hypothetical protein